MSEKINPIDTSTHEVFPTEVIQSDDGEEHTHALARICTKGVDIRGFKGYVTEIAPPISDSQEQVVRNIGGEATKSIGLNHTTIVIGQDEVRNILPVTEYDAELSSARVGQAYVELFFTQYNIE